MSHTSRSGLMSDEDRKLVDIFMAANATPQGRMFSEALLAGIKAVIAADRAAANAPASENRPRKELVESMNEIIHDHVVTMQAAVIEWQHGKGAEAAMGWIANTLEGPGHLPGAEEPWGKDAQRYFDANRAKPFPLCAVCGIPSHQLWMGHGFCSTEHHDKFKAEHPEGK